MNPKANLNNNIMENFTFRPQKTTFSARQIRTLGEAQSPDFLLGRWVDELRHFFFKKIKMTEKLQPVYQELHPMYATTKATTF